VRATLAPELMPVSGDGTSSHSSVHPTGQYSKKSAGSRSPAVENRQGSVYQSPWHQLGGSLYPVYEVRGTQIFRTAWHPSGPSPHPLFELRGGQIFRTVWNEDAS
jgi:hypothetical protein